MAAPDSLLPMLPRPLGLALSLCLFAAPALAARLGPHSKELEQAQALVEQGEFEKAIETLERGLSQPYLSEDQLVEMYRLQGLAYLYLGQEGRAQTALEKLLQARPDFQLPPGTPPKIRVIYERLQEAIRKRRVRPVTLTFEPLREVHGGQPVELVAAIANMAAGAKAKIYYRRGGAQAFSSVDLQRQADTDRFTATLPAYELPAESRAYDMEYYVEISDSTLRRLAGQGDAYSPLLFKVTPLPIAQEPMREAPGAPPTGAAWYSNPWIWVGVGAVAAGATAGAVMVATQRPSGSLPITIQVENTP